METCRQAKIFSSKLKIKTLAVDWNMHPQMTGMDKHKLTKNFDSLVVSGFPSFGTVLDSSTWFVQKAY